MGTPRSILILTLTVALAGCAGTPAEETQRFDGRAPLRLRRPDVSTASAEAEAAEVTPTASRRVIEQGLSLEDAYRIARAANPTLAAAGEGVSAARARVRQAEVFSNPVFTVNKAEVPTQTGPLSSDTNPSVHAWDLRGSTTTFALQKDFDLSGKRLARVEGALESARQTEAQYAGAALQLRAQVHVAYAGVLVAGRNLELAREARDMAKKNLEIVAGRAAGGNALPADSLRAEADANRSEIDLDLALREAVRSRRALAALLAAPETDVGTPTGTLPLSRLPADADETRLIAGALERNPDVVAAKRGVLAADANVRLQERSAVPDLTVQVGWNRYFLDRNDTLSLNLAMPLPVFDQNRGQVLESRALLRQARRQQEATENEVVRAIRDDLQVLRVSRERVDRFEKEILPRNREAARLVELSFQGGNVLYLDVIAARAAFNQSRADYVVELATYEQAFADLERVTGVSVELDGL